MIPSMDPTTLAQRLRLGEDTRTEFKSVVHNRYRIDRHVIAKSIVALANSGGGVVVVGAEDDGTPSGIGTQQQADALMRQISQVCRDAVHPAIVCKQIKVRVEDETLLVVEVPAFAPERPYAAGGKYYVRDANRSREATRAERIRLLQSTDLHYDEQPVAGATLDELDLAVAQKLLAKAFETPREDQVVPYLRALRCLDPENTPTVCGLLFFGREPQRWLLDARISAVRVPGTEPRLELSDSQEITGTLTEQLAGARAFFDRHLSHPAQVAGWDRVEAPLLPDEVLLRGGPQRRRPPRLPARLAGSHLLLRRPDRGHQSRRVAQPAHGREHPARRYQPETQSLDRFPAGASGPAREPQLRDTGDVPLDATAWPAGA